MQCSGDCSQLLVDFAGLAAGTQPANWTDCGGTAPMNGTLAAIVAAFNGSAFLLPKCNLDAVSPTPCCTNCTWSYANKAGDFTIVGVSFTGGHCTCTFINYSLIIPAAAAVAFTSRSARTFTRPEPW